MNELLAISERLVERVPLSFYRYLVSQIDWNNRLIGIKGARGTGKTTMLLQWLKHKNLGANEAAYFSLDELFFSTHSLLDTGRDFYNRGGKIMALDEVHKYNGWAGEIKNLYDRYNDLQIVFTGSSIIDISKQEGDLSRRAVIHELHGLSFREFLTMKGVIDMSPLVLKDLLAKQSAIRKIFPIDFRPLEHFNAYLSHGYYPFFEEDMQGYHIRLRQLVRQIIEYDMAELKGFDIRNAKKMLQLLGIISQQVPFKPNLQKLAEKSQIHRNSISNYLFFLEQARMIHLLYPSGMSVSTLQKPEKIFLNNTNLMFAVASSTPDIGNIRETFVLNQLLVGHHVTQPKTGDFEVNGEYIFEVGGVSKTSKQIREIENAFLVKDKLDFPVGNEIPLWLFGFLY